MAEKFGLTDFLISVFMNKTVNNYFSFRLKFPLLHFNCGPSTRPFMKKKHNLFVMTVSKFLHVHKIAGSLWNYTSLNKRAFWPNVCNSI